MNWIIVIALIAAGILALSGLIIAQKPQAKDLIDRLVPIQGIVGIVLLVLGAIKVVRVMQHSTDLTGSHMPTSILLAQIAACTGALGLGFLFGMPLIAKWIPGETPAEQKAMEMQQKLLPFQTILGAVAIVGSILLAYVTNKYPLTW